MILPDQNWSRAKGYWQRAEEFGFDHAWTYDHLGWRDLVDGPWFDAMTTLTAAAGVTSAIRLGPLVASPNFRHPVRFARSVVTLDDVSAGRLTLGIGVGGAGFDTTVLGGSPLSVRARVDRFAEFLELLDELLVAGQATWQGEYYQAVDARSTPGCVQRPRVPFLVAANGPRSIALAARFGQSWVTTGAPADSWDQWWRGVAVAARRFEEALAVRGRDQASVARYLSFDAGPVYSLSSVAVFEEAVGRAGELGFTDVITHWPRQTGWYAGDEAVLEAVAADVLPRLATTARTPLRSGLANE